MCYAGVISSCNVRAVTVRYGTGTVPLPYAMLLAVRDGTVRYRKVGACRSSGRDTAGLKRLFWYSAYHKL